MDLVFVHGALVRDGEWWWHRTGDLLEQRTGVVSHSVPLPSCGETSQSAAAAGLSADAAALRATLDTSDEVVVVGHSYGGTVIAEAGAHPAVRHRVLITSYLPDAGQSQGQIMADEPDPVSVVGAGEGLVQVAGLDAHSFGTRFLAGADDHAADHEHDELRREAWSRVTPQALASFTTATTEEGWRDGDSTYLVCTQDRSTSLELQRRHAARATRSVDLPTGHHPFLTHPEIVVEQLIPLLR